MTASTKRITLAVSAALLAAAAVTGLVLTNQSQPAPAAKPAAIKHEAPASLSGPIKGIDSLINAERAKRHLQPLKLNADLNTSATAKAQDVVAKDYWSHTAPDGTTPWDLIDKTGYKYTHAGENLGKCYSSLSDFVAAWIASPTHLDNITGDYTDFGFGYATKPDGCMVVVNHFGRR